MQNRRPIISSSIRAQYESLNDFASRVYLKSLAAVFTAACGASLWNNSFIAEDGWTIGVAEHALVTTSAGIAAAFSGTIGFPAGWWVGFLVSGFTQRSVARYATSICAGLALAIPSGLYAGVYGYNEIQRILPGVMKHFKTSATEVIMPLTRDVLPAAATIPGKVFTQSAILISQYCL